MDAAEQRELAELLAEEELADQEVARFVASMQQAESSGGRPAAPVMPLETPVPLVAPFTCIALKPDEVIVSEYYLRMIRRKLYEFFVFKKEVPTVDKLQRVLKRELNILCSRKALLKVLRDDGFRIGRRQEVIRLSTGEGRHPTLLFTSDDPF